MIASYRSRKRRKKNCWEGIVLASAAKEKPQTGTVVAVGEGRLLENGEKVPAAVKAATKLYSKNTPVQK